MRDTSFDDTVIVDPITGDPMPAGAFERAWGAVLNALLRAAGLVFYVVAPPIDDMTAEELERTEQHFIGACIACVAVLTVIFVGFNFLAVRLA